MYKTLSALLLALSTCSPILPVMAEDYYGSPRAMPEEVQWVPFRGAGESILGSVVFSNRLVSSSQGSEQEYYTFETEAGNIVIFHVRTPEINCEGATCPDTIYVEALPEGYVAIPDVLTVDEFNTDSIKVIRYFGS